MQLCMSLHYIACVENSFQFAAAVKEYVVA